MCVQHPRDGVPVAVVEKTLQSGRGLLGVCGPSCWADAHVLSNDIESTGRVLPWLKTQTV